MNQESFNLWDERAPIISLVTEDMGNLRVWEYPVHDYQYLIAADVAEGVRQDFSVGHVLKIPRDLGDIPEQVAVYASNNMDAHTFGVKLFLLGLYYHDAIIAIERNGPGLRTLAALERGDPDVPATQGGYPNLFEEVRYTKRDPEGTKRMGFRTDSTTRPMILEHLRKRINEESIIIHSRTTLDELKGCQRDFEKRKFIQKHKNPVSNLFNDDHLISLAIGCQLLEDVQVRGFFRKFSTAEPDRIQPFSELLNDLHFGRPIKIDAFNYKSVFRNILSSQAAIYAVEGDPVRAQITLIEIKRLDKLHNYWEESTQ